MIRLETNKAVCWADESLVTIICHLRMTSGWRTIRGNAIVTIVVVDRRIQHRHGWGRKWGFKDVAWSGGGIYSHLILYN